MIDWKNVNELHVVSKIKNIVSKWFNVDLIFIDNFGRIKSEHLVKGFPYESYGFKVLSEVPGGPNVFQGDFEKIAEYFSNAEEKSYRVWESELPGLRGVSYPIYYDGQYLGCVVAYAFIFDSMTPADEKKLMADFEKIGALKNHVSDIVSNIKKMTSKEVEYLGEFVSLVGEEITTYYDEIDKREQRIQELNSELGDKYRYHTMIGKSKKMQQIYRLLEKVSATDSSVFIQGDNGTGKELVAKAIHFYSHRKDKMFLAVNCSAFNDNLLDSELFGHVKGAFTGAIKDKKGVFEESNGGTLFLDEIGDTSLAMQVKLLRVLQEGTFLPVGATSQRKTDVRIIAATNKPIKEMMERGEFREDLYYRINVINVNLPSLKDRAEDIPLLMDFFIQKRCQESGLPTKQFSKKCMEKMLDYAWPGNVRELQNEVERLVVLSANEKTITPELLSSRILDHGVTTPQIEGVGLDTSGSLKIAMEELEIIMIREGLKRTGFNKSRLAKELGISRASLIMKVEKYGLDKRKKIA